MDMPVCSLCGAVGHGNITCPNCRDQMEWMPSSTKKILEKCKIGYPVGTVEGSQYAMNIEKENQKRKAPGLTLNIN